MSNFKSVIILGMFIGLINEISLSLGITTEIWEAPEVISDIEDGGFLEGLLSVARWSINNIGSFFQLITFTAEVPDVINALILAPIGFGVFYLIYVMIRGGAG